ncbi:MAG: DUF1295 domain-containing protein [Gammaproteobacteria bacterium]|nr:DUF1295 domain-containing protein [Gammaproteobacteria bacterium]
MTWYTGNTFYDTVLTIGFVIAILIFLGNRYGTAKYGGRFGESKKGGFRLSSKMGWILMELPALIIFPIVFFMGSNAMQPVPLFFLALWTFHYMNRAIINPMLMRTAPGSQNSFDPSVMIFGWVVLAIHAYLNAAYISELGTHYQSAWFSNPIFITGIAIYVFGFTLNVYSDHILRNLRSKTPQPNEPRYKIPYGGMFKFVTCPQYLGEIISFVGLAVMTWNLGAVFVVAVTMANLIPRALITHRWFQEKFANYPAERRAIFPYVL